MSLSGDGASSALKAPAFIVGIAVLIVTVLYVTKRCGPNLFGQEAVSRNYSRGSNDPPEIMSDTGEKPRMCDVWIVSWYPLCSQPGSRSGRLGLGEGQSEDGKKSGWAEFLVSCPTCLPNQPLSVSLRLVCLCQFFWISSHYLQTRCQTQMLTLPHPKRRAIIPSGPHHRPKSKSISSSSCRPLIVPRLHLRLPHRTRPPTTSMTHQENMCLGRLTSHTPQATSFLLLGLRGTCVVTVSTFHRCLPATSTRSVVILLFPPSFSIFS